MHSMTYLRIPEGMCLLILGHFTVSEGMRPLKILFLHHFNDSRFRRRQFFVVILSR